MGFWYRSVFFVFLFYHLPRKLPSQQKQNNTKKNISQQNTYRTGIFVQHNHLCFQVFLFLFQFDFFSLLKKKIKNVSMAELWFTDRRGDRIKSKLIRRCPSERFIVHSASLLTFRNACASQKKEQMEHWWALGACMQKKRWLFYLLKKELLAWEKLEVFFFFSSSRRKSIYLFVQINGNKTEDGSKFSGTDKFLLLAMIMASYLFLFVMVSKLNDLITNICCNSETCLPTNKLLIKIHHLATTKVLVFCLGLGTLFIWITAKVLQMMERSNFFFF